MIKLFIVDDEPNTREGLRYYFDWHKYDIEVVGEADDGSIALEPILRLLPDIVLTDIRMPEMDGLQLANKLRDAKSETKIIFVSGYEDINYLKTALKVKAVDYILKPVNLEELAAVIEKTIKAINEEKAEKRLIYEMNAKLIESMPTLREKFFMTLVRDGIDEEIDINEKIRFLELQLPNDANYCVIALSIDDKLTKFEYMTEKDKQIMCFSIINICEELINKSMSGYIFENRIGEYVCILKIKPSDPEDNLYTLISDIKESMLKYLKISFTIGVGFIVHGLVNLSKSYSKAYENVSQRLFLGKNNIITVDSLETEEDFTYKFDIEKVQQLTNLLKSVDEIKLTKAIEEIFMQISKYKYANVKYCINVCLQLLLTSSRVLMELQINNEEIDIDENEVWEELFKLETLEDMKNSVTRYFVKLCKHISIKRNKKCRNVIEQIKKIIDNKYKENIGINDIAQEVYLTTTYLCMVFKQETGETVNDYLTKVRIEKARELLKEPKNKLYDICYEIGYSEPGYFSKIFKKHTGLTPSEYRENLL